jgi:hypothetical protein
MVAPSAVCPFHVDQAVRGLQVLGSASIGHLLASGHNTCNVAAAAAAHRLLSLQEATAGWHLRHFESSTLALEELRKQQDSLVVESCEILLGVLQVLCGLPAAQGLPAAAVEQLLPALPGLMCEHTRLLRYSVELHKSCEGAQLCLEAYCTLTGPLKQSFQNMCAWRQLVQQLLDLPSAEQVILQLQHCQEQPLKASISAAEVRTAAASDCL